jgi:colanic acid/amylovoran biosynthesis glycosyltransferase
MKKKVYFILGGYPVVSQSFLYNQITEVIKQDAYDVRIIVLSKKEGSVHPAYERLNEKVIFFSTGRENGVVSKVPAAIKAFGKLLFRKPILLFKALNFFKYGRDAVNGTYMILADQFLDIKPDLLHCHFGTTARVIGDLKDMKAINCKLITSFHGKDITVYPKQFGNAYYTRLFSSSEMFTGNSKYIINKMIDTGCPIGQIVKIPMCLNTSQFLYREHLPSTDTLRILTVGRFVEKKGHQYAIRAVALLKKTGVKFVYHLIGEGPLLDDSKALAKELNIYDDLIFHGAMMQNEVIKHYQQADVFLLPSVTAADGDTEGQGLVLQEAQAIGLPVIATLHNGFPDSIIDGTTGFLVRERDANALFEKLMLLAGDGELRNKMGRLGRTFVESHFDARIIGKELTAVYNKLLQTA